MSTLSSGITPDAGTNTLPKATFPILFGGIFLYTALDTLQQTILPIALQESGLSVTLIGLIIAIPQGVAFLTAPPSAAYSDRNGRAGVTSLMALLCGLAFVGLAVASSTSHPILWVIPIVLMGLTRMNSFQGFLTTVSTNGNPLVMQGINGAVQRGAAAGAAILASATIAWATWETAFISLAFAFAVLAGLAHIGLRSTRPTVKVDSPMIRRSYALSFRLIIRDKAVQASSLTAICCVTTMTVGNSFFALTLDLPSGDLVGYILVLLLTRDLSSIAWGMAFRALVLKLSLPGVIALSVALTGVGIVLLSFAKDSFPILVMSALMQGAALAWCIGAANMLAVLAGGTGGPQLRMATSTVLPSVFSLALPVILGALLDHVGRFAMFGLAGVLVVGLGFGAALMARGLTAAERSVNAKIAMVPSRPDTR